MGDSLLFLIVLAVVLFPVFWWFMSERGGDTTNRPLPPVPGSDRYGQDIDTGYGPQSGGLYEEQDTGYGERSSSTYITYGERSGSPYGGPPPGGVYGEQIGAEQSARSGSLYGQTSETTQPIERGPGLESSIGGDPSSLEPWSGPEGGPDDEAPLDTVHGPAPQPHEDAWRDQRPLPSLQRSPHRAEPGRVRGRRARRAVLTQIRNRRGLRQAILVQAVIGAPKALEDEAGGR